VAEKDENGGGQSRNSTGARFSLCAAGSPPNPPREDDPVVFFPPWVSPNANPIDLVIIFILQIG